MGLRARCIWWDGRRTVGMERTLMVVAEAAVDAVGGDDQVEVPTPRSVGPIAVSNSIVTPSSSARSSRTRKRVWRDIAEKP